MKLAEALMLRGDIQKKLTSLRERIVRNSTVQEGDTPHEDPNALLKEAFGVIEELEGLVKAINTANLTHKLPDGRTITELLAKRDSLVQWHSVLQAALSSTQRDPDRYGVREIRWVSTLNVVSLQKQVEDLAKKIRECNALIQATNWEVEL